MKGMVDAKNQIKKAVIGKDQVIEQILMTLIARGHILLEDIPGVGKTNLALALSSLVLEGNPLFDQEISTILSHINQWFRGPNVTGMSATMDGSLPNGNVSLNDDIALTVKSDCPFYTYLKGYSLAHYDHNQWYKVNNEYDSTKFHSNNLMYQWIQRSTNTSIVEVSITTSSPLEYQFVPYYTYMYDQEMEDSYYLKNDKTMRVLACELNFDEMMDPQGVTTSFEKYDDYVKSEYLEVNEDLKVKLIDYLEQKVQKETKEPHSLQQIINQYNEKERVHLVKDILFHNNTYELKAGILPENEDFVEYFLSKNHKGSCTHFASSAALLLRCLNIPTRFVRGYVVKFSDFQDGEAKIANNRAHAWIEIYVKGKGWIPVEVTPTSLNSGMTQEDVATMLDGLQETQKKTSNQQTPTNNNQNQTTQTTNKRPTVYQSFHGNTYIMSLGLILLFLLIYRYMSLHWLSFQLKNKSTNQQVILYYRRMKKILRLGGTFNEEIENLAMKALFSQYRITDEEMMIVKKEFNQWIKETYQTVSRPQKIRMKILGYM